MVETSGSSLCHLAKSERCRKVLQYISSAPPRLFFQAIRCTSPSCLCECFLPSKSCLRTCESCQHGWVAHALDKLGYRHMFNVGIQVEIVQPNIVFDIASLVLYGAHATPTRLKILLDRLFNVLQHEEVLQVLHGFGWSYEDYARGYILQETSGRVLDKWMCATQQEEFTIVQQFLRFGETKSIAQDIIIQDTYEQDAYGTVPTRNDSEIKKFTERSNVSMQNWISPFEVRQFFGAHLPFIRSPGAHLLSPQLPGFTTPSTNLRDLRPPLMSVTSTSPLRTSPPGWIQTMQPFESCRHEPISLSSMSPREKQQPSSSNCDTPQTLNLSSVSAKSSPPSTSYTSQRSSNIESTLTSLPTMYPSVGTGTKSKILPTAQRHQHKEGALNFSVKNENDHSHFGDRKIKHLRKSSNLLKHNWIAESSFGSSTIGPNGKKRVLCSACSKTFCDKGALKIHYSAVHLKEMHKCSVDGCTMMFSSRRSRNRHSANPNPKLHMTQKRPKVHNGTRLVEDGSSPNQKHQLSSSPTIGIPSGMVSGRPYTHTDSPNHRTFYADPNIVMPMFPSAAKKFKLDNDANDDSATDLSLLVFKENNDSRESSPDNQRLTLISESILDDKQMNAKESFVVNWNSYSSCSPRPQRSQNRRKNIPTRCVQSSAILEEHNTNTGSKTSLDDDSINYQDTVSSSGDQRDDINGAKSKKKFKRKKHSNCEKVECDETSLDKTESKLVIDDEMDNDFDDEDSDQNDAREVLDFAICIPDDLDGDVEILDIESKTSLTSTETESLESKINFGGFSDCEMPIDKDNPKQCGNMWKTVSECVWIKNTFQKCTFEVDAYIFCRRVQCFVPVETNP